MKKADVKVGQMYRAKVSNKVVEVRIDGESPHGGWNATNLATGKAIRIKTAQRLRPGAGAGVAKEEGAANGAEAGQAETGDTAVPVAKKAEEAAAPAPEAKDATRANVRQRAEMAKGTKEAAPEKAPKRKRGKQATTAVRGAKTAASKPAAPKRTSALDAAAQLLARAKEPMRCKDMIEAMAAKGLWESPGGKTPAATLNAAIIREIAKKGADSRFVRAGRGLFAASTKGGK